MEKLLLDVPPPFNWVPDEYDVGWRDIIVNWRDADAVIAQALETAADGTDAIFPSVDIDGLDLSIAPGTCAPNPGGLSTYESLELVWQIGRHPLCRGFDVAEVAPSLDVGGVTCMMGAALIMQFLAAAKVRLNR